MRKFGRDILKFLLFASGIYLILLFVFESLIISKFRPNLITKKSFNSIRLNDVKKNYDVDILFLGSSHAYTGFDTRIFKSKGYNSFNLGSNSQTPLQTEVVLRRYLKQLNPKLIVFEVYPDLFSSDGIESSLDIIASDINDKYSFKLLFEKANIKLFNTFIYHSIIDFIKGQKTIMKPSLNSVYKYHEGGYVSREMNYYKHDIFGKYTVKIKQNQIKAFERIINMFNKEKINFVLVQAPITKGRYNSRMIDLKFSDLMKKHGEYYNFNDLIKLDDSLHFRDHNHLNQDGVDIFNKKFLELVFKNKK